MSDEDLARAMTRVHGPPTVERSADGTATAYTFTPSADVPPIRTYTIGDHRTPEARFVDNICARLEAGGFRRADAEAVNGNGVRCPTPKCGKKVAESLKGTLVITCRHCGQTQTITR